MLPQQAGNSASGKYPEIQEHGYNVPDSLCYIFDTSGRISTFRDYDVLRRNFRILVTEENFWDTYKDWDDDYLVPDWERYIIHRFRNNGVPTSQLLRSLRYMDLENMCDAWNTLHEGEELQERAGKPYPGDIPQRFYDIADMLCTEDQLALFPIPEEFVHPRGLRVKCAG